MADLTYNMVDEYINSDGTACPFCGSLNIEAGHFDAEGVSQPVRCEDCDEKWQNIYQLVGVHHGDKELFVTMGASNG